MVTKKKHAVFRVPNYGAKNRKGVKKRWRKPRGIDSKIRVEKKGHGAVPKVGYKNAPAVRYMRKDGTWESLVHNEAELLALQGAKDRSAVIAHGLSRRRKEALQKLAESKGIAIANKVKAKAAEKKAAKKQQAPAPKQAPAAAPKQAAEKAPAQEEAKRPETPAQTEVK